MKKLFLLLSICTIAYISIFAVKYTSPTISKISKPYFRFEKFQETDIISCKPEGWLREFLNRQRSGLTGHPEVLSYPFNTCLWGGIIERQANNHGDNWWRYEQTAYYTDGLLRLGYLLQDSSLIKKGREGINYTLDHPQKNGRLGPDLFSNQWPIAVFFRAMQAEYMATRNPRIIDALHRHYLSYTPEEGGNAQRAIVNIEGMLWTYDKTKDEKLLELAEKAYNIGGFELNMKGCLSDDVMILHGVTYMEMAKLPAILYACTGKKIYLDAAINAFKKLDRDHMLPDGVPSSNEFLSGKDPLNSHETCDITDYTWAVGYLLMATGDATWADHIEKAVFNAGPGAVSKDFKNLQYFSSVNQVIATGNSNQNKYKHGTTWMAYWPCHETECCAGNVHRFMPNYVARMWMRNNEGGPVAALYGPSIEKIALDNETKTLTIHEQTNYPFSDQISFGFDTQSPVDLPFTFRIPAWCHTASVTINNKPYNGKLLPGTFVTIKRRFQRGDRINVHLPMSAKLVKWNKWGIAVERGPILFAYAIAEKVKVDTATYANLNGKKSLNPAFPALDIRPAASWNYALAVNQKNLATKIKINETKKKTYPLDPGQSPIIIKIPANKVLDWQLADGRYTPELPELKKFKIGKEVETITLVPYGSTRLRLSVFPESY
jgi:hypothetical protein